MPNDNNTHEQFPTQMPAANVSRRPHVSEAAGAHMPKTSGGPEGAKTPLPPVSDPRTNAASPGSAQPVPPARSSVRRNIIVVLLILVMAIAVWLLVWLFACNGSSLFDPSAQTVQAPYKTDEEIQAELDRVVEEGMFNISIASVIEFEDGTSEGTAYIENVPGNHYNMQVSIAEDETGDVLYESGVLAPNQYIEKIALAKDLEPGTYEATATFRAVDTTTFDEIGQAAAKVSIVVLN